MLSDTLRRIGPISGAGISRVDFSFKIFSGRDVEVIRTTEGVDKTLVLQQDYTITYDKDQVANIGGYITLNDFLLEGETITLLSAVEYTQNLDLHSEGDFNPQDINTELDRHVAQIQQLKEKLGRAAVVPASKNQSGDEYGEELLKNSETAREFAERAKESANASAKSATESEKYAKQIKEQAEYAAGADKYATEAEQARALAYAASADASTSADLSEDWAQKSKEFAEKSGFGFRYCEGATSGESIYVKNVVPPDLLKVGDHIVNRDGEVFLVVEVSEDKSTCTLSKKITSLQGPAGADGKDGERGPQGEPGPEGLQGPQGPMGESPWATAFGQFRLEDPYLKLDYVGADLGTVWNIREDGQLTVDIEEQ